MLLNLLQNLLVFSGDIVQWTLWTQSLGAGLLIRSEEKYELIPQNLIYINSHDQKVEFDRPGERSPE